MEKEKDIIKMLNEAAGIDEHLQFIMRELEHCDDMIYNENLSAAHFVYWMARKETLQQMRDNYCSFKKK